MNNSELIKNIRNRFGYNQTEMANALGIQQGSYSPIEKGDVGISAKVRKALIKNLNVNPEYLNGNSDEMIIENIEINNLTTKGIPIYDVDFTAGNITKFSDFSEQIIGRVEFEGYKRCIAFVKVKGDSMYPELIGGDLIGLEPQLDFTIIEYGQVYAIATKNDQYLVKIIRRGVDNDNLILRSKNKEYDDIDLHKKNIDKLFKVHGPIRDKFY